jgi:hypothetical protein
MTELDRDYAENRAIFGHNRAINARIRRGVRHRRKMTQR